MKQWLKHEDKRTAKWQARREVPRANLEATLTPLVADAGMTLVRLDFLRGLVSLTAHGAVRTPDGVERRFAFRYRGDRAFVEIGTADPDWPHLIGEAALVASCSNRGKLRIARDGFASLDGVWPSRWALRCALDSCTGTGEKRDAGLP